MSERLFRRHSFRDLFAPPDEMIQLVAISTPLHVCAVIGGSAAADKNIFNLASAGQIAIIVGSSGKLSGHGAAIDLIGKKLIEKTAKVLSLGFQQAALFASEKSGKLLKVAAIGFYRKPRQPLFHFQVISETGQQNGFWRAGNHRHIAIIRCWKMRRNSKPDARLRQS